MNFLDAYKRVLNFADAAANKRGKTLFIPRSSVYSSEQELLDAFIIFYGHMVAFNTRTMEEYKNLRFIDAFMYNIVDDNLFDSLKENHEILERSKNNPFYSLTHKGLIENAKRMISVEAELMGKKMGLNGEEARFDMDEYIDALSSLKEEYRQKAEEEREDFNSYFRKYINTVYSYTSQKRPTDADIYVFVPMEEINKRLRDVVNIPISAVGLKEKYSDILQLSK